MTHPSTDHTASRQLADTLRAQIADGAYPPGSKLPSYRQLRDSHHVALNTAQAAIRMLAADGLVEIRPASGAFVRERSDNGKDRRCGPSWPTSRPSCGAASKTWPQPRRR